MQDTRQKILEYLNIYGQASVEELRDWLDGITAVTVRHHLDVLRRDGLVAAPEVQRRDTPGRPKFIYMLTSKASEYFPKNFRKMTDYLLEELSEQMSSKQINVIFTDVGQRMAAEGPMMYAGQINEERLQAVVEFLSEQGYQAGYEPYKEGFLLHTCNCPYDRVAGSTDFLCAMDMSMMTELLGMVPRRLDHIIDGAVRCSYFVPSE